MLEKLRWETAQVKTMLAAGDPRAIYAAFNAAATAWHICDWVMKFARVHPIETPIRGSS
jgi:hypothetical protein